MSAEIPTAYGPTTTVVKMEQEQEVTVEESDSIEVLVDDDDDFEVEVVDDRPEEDRVEPREETRNAESDDFDQELTEKEIDEIGARSTKRIKRLRYEYHEERRAKEASDKMREEAINYAKHMQTENEQLRGTLARGEEVLLNEVRSRTDIAVSAAREQYKKAVEEGDSDAIVAANEILNDAQISRATAKQYDRVLEATVPGMNPVEPQYAPQVPQYTNGATQADPAQDPKLKDWLATNTWFNKDSEMTSLAVGIHKNLTEKLGMSPYSDEYYNRVDERLREIAPKFFGVKEEKGNLEPAAPRTPSVVASPGRSGVGPRPNTVQLTKSAAAVAGRLGLTTKQYARQVLLDSKKDQ